MGVVIFVTMRYEKYGVGGSKCDALRNANEKIENALIDIVSPKNEWCNRGFGVTRCLSKCLINLRANESIVCLTA